MGKIAAMVVSPITGADVPPQQYQMEQPNIEIVREEQADRLKEDLDEKIDQFLHVDGKLKDEMRERSKEMLDYESANPAVSASGDPPPKDGTMDLNFDKDGNPVLTYYVPEASDAVATTDSSIPENLSESDHLELNFTDDSAPAWEIKDEYGDVKAAEDNAVSPSTAELSDLGKNKK